MPTRVPGHVAVGDAGHAEHHNALADVETEMSSRLDELEAAGGTQADNDVRTTLSQVQDDLNAVKANAMTADERFANVEGRLDEVDAQIARLFEMVANLGPQ